MKIGRKNFQNDGIYLGIAIAFALMVIPKVSEPVINFVNSIRAKIGGNK